MVPLFCLVKATRRYQKKTKPGYCLALQLNQNIFLSKKKKIKEQENLDNKKHRCVGSLSLNQNINKILR